MSIIQHHTAASLSDAWRTVNIDILTEDSSVNFDTSTLRPPQPEIAEADVRALASQVRQLLRGGDAEGALRSCLETPVYNGTDAAKVCTLSGRNLSIIHSPLWLIHIAGDDAVGFGIDRGRLG
jgi:hypothetical protein